MSCSLIKSIGLGIAVVILLAPSTLLADTIALHSLDKDEIPAGEPKSPVVGATLMVVGTAAVLVGATVKFGGGEELSTGFGTFVEKPKEHNAGNWILIGAGSFLVLLGVYELATRNDTEPRPVFGWRGDDHEMLVGLEMNF